MSRAVEHIQLYADDLSKWVKTVKERSGERETVHDVMLRGEDLKATNELNLWKRSQPVSATRLAAKIEDGIADAAHFRSGKTPELLYAVLNEHGRQRATGMCQFRQRLADSMLRMLTMLGRVTV
ncbi:hypothetical protein LNO03_26515 [Klebsiella pneumoniae subsp. pneumoniae]|nr:hypothetical protein [Klebsiella pneumoniae subsp. pneumoniae]